MIIHRLIWLISLAGDGAWFLFGLATWLLSLGAATVSISNATSKSSFIFKGWS